LKVANPSLPLYHNESSSFFFFDIILQKDMGEDTGCRCACSNHAALATATVTIMVAGVGWFTEFATVFPTNILKASSEGEGSQRQAGTNNLFPCARLREKGPDASGERSSSSSNNGWQGADWESELAKGLGDATYDGYKHIVITVCHPELTRHPFAGMVTAPVQLRPLYIVYEGLRHG
jgi:hypothetical protein